MDKGSRDILCVTKGNTKYSILKYLNKHDSNIKLFFLNAKTTFHRILNMKTKMKNVYMDSYEAYNSL